MSNIGHTTYRTRTKKTYNTENQKDEQHRSHKIKEGVEEFEDTNLLHR
jgi:hypothetical protein